MDYTNYLLKINQINVKYSWNKKNAKFILNILYNEKEVYRLERYKDLMKELIQIFCEKIDLKEISYQVIYKKIRKEIGLYIILIYFEINKRFNCNFYIINIGKRIF